MLKEIILKDTIQYEGEGAEVFGINGAFLLLIYKSLYRTYTQIRPGPGWALVDLQYQSERTPHEHETLNVQVGVKKADSVGLRIISLTAVGEDGQVLFTGRWSNYLKPVEKAD